MPQKIRSRDTTLAADSSSETAATAAIESMIGKQMANYRIVEKIGEGGMGVVYRAQDTLLGRTVAIKVMNPKVAEAPDFEKRFLREAKAASSLNHPNITQIYQLLDEQGTKCIVMEYLKGSSLEALLKKQGTIGYAEAVRIAEHVAMALDAAQTEGLIHRDIKPDNIGFDEKGVVKLLDFGLAKWRDSPKAAEGFHSMTGDALMGTPRYMSPEMILQGSTDGRSDLFSLGIVLHEMVTGEHPFPGQDKIALINEIAHGKPIPPETFNVPGDLATIITRLLQKDPADRYQSAKELLGDLAKVKLSLPTGRTVLRRRRLKGRHAVWAAVLAAILLAVGVGGYYLYVRPFGEGLRPSNAPATVTLLPIVNRTGDDSVSKLVLPLTQLLIASLRPLRSVDVLDLDRLATVAGALDARGDEGPDPALYARLRRARPTTAIIQPALFKAGDQWQMAIDFRDPLTGERLDRAECSQDVGSAPQANLGLLVDSAARVIADKFGIGGAEPLATPGRLGPGRVAALQAVAEGVRLSLQEEHVQAREAFQRAMQSDPSDPMIMVRLSAENRALGYDKEAERHARQASGMINESMSIAQGYEIDATLAEVTYQYDRARELLQKLINLYPRRPEYPSRLGQIEHEAGRYGEAEKTWRNAVLLAPEYSPALIALAGLCTEQARYRESIDWYGTADKVFEGIGSREGRAAVLCGLGDIDYRQNRIEEGQKKYEEALEIYRASSHSYGIAQCTSAIGLGDQSLGKLSDAGRRFRSATELYEKLGNSKALAREYLSRSGWCLLKGDYDAALAFCKQAEQVAEQLGNRVLFAECQELSGRALYYLGRYSEADARLRSAIEAFRQVSDKREEGYASWRLAILCEITGRFDDCLALAARGTRLAQEIADPLLSSRFEATVSEISQLRGDYTRAVQIRQKLLAVARSNRDDDDAAYSAYNAARAYVGLGDFAKAQSLLDEADGYFSQIGNSVMHGLVLLCRIDALRESRTDDPKKLAGLATEVAASIGTNPNKAYELLGKGCRALYTGSTPDQRETIRRIDDFLATQTADILMRVQLERMLGQMCLLADDRDTGRRGADRMIHTARALRMPEYGCNGCLLELQFAGTAHPVQTRDQIMNLGSRWWAEMVSAIPESGRAQYESRRSISEMKGVFGKKS